MKHTLLVSMTVLTLILSSCAPATPTEVNLVPEVSTTMPQVIEAVEGTSEPLPTNAPPTPIPSLAGGLSPTELKYRLLEEYPNFFFCDPDIYPVARDDSNLAMERFPEIQADAEEFQTILAHNGLTGLASFTDDQKALIYREHKKLTAITLELTGVRYHFQLTTNDGGRQGLLVSGWIDGQGIIEVQDRTPTVASCPICLALHTLIATPRGPVAVEALRAGDSVWTMNAAGERVAGMVLMVTQTPVPAWHKMVHVVLEDGRELWVSPGHPTADGRTIGDLKAGDSLDGSRVVSAERVRYGQPATYDLLSSGATGFYWANGILMESTLK
jgi:hypothetical protein